MEVHDEASTVSEQNSARPWTALYPAACGPELVPVYGDLLSIFRDAVQQGRDRAAILYFDRAISYGDLDRHSDAAALWLVEQGIGKGDRVCIMTQNTPAFPIMCLASWKIGAVAVPANPMYRRNEMARIFSDAQPRALCCQDSELEEMIAALDESGRHGVALCTVSLADWRAGDASTDFSAPLPDVQAARLTTIIDRDDSQQLEPVPLSSDDVGLLLYTSGTTGEPKGAMLKHGSMAFNSQLMRDWCGLDQDTPILGIAPLFHVTGLVCHMGVAFSAACTLILNFRFETGVVLEMIRTHKPVFTIGAITAFNALMQSPEASREDMASLSKVYSGGAPIPPSLRDTIQDKFGFEIHPTYGMTELTSAAVLCPPGKAVPQRDGVLSIGIATPSTDIRIVNDQGVTLAPGCAGEIVVRGPQVMAGYWRKPEETAAALVDGWMHTGDVGFVDEDGWIFLIDRKKDVIIASGFKVWPREVEDVLYSHPAVREVAVIGVPDSYRGETVKACIALLPGQHTTEEALRAFCREKLASYKVPRIITLMDDLPKTISGKIQRASLREK